MTIGFDKSLIIATLPKSGLQTTPSAGGFLIGTPRAYAVSYCALNSSSANKSLRAARRDASTARLALRATPHKLTWTILHIDISRRASLAHESWHAVWRDENQARLRESESAFQDPCVVSTTLQRLVHRNNSYLIQPERRSFHDLRCTV